MNFIASATPTPTPHLTQTLTLTLHPTLVRTLNVTAPSSCCTCPAGFRERLLADPGFFVKLSIELGIGLVCKITAEAQKRGESFKNELDFVFANVVRRSGARSAALYVLTQPTFQVASDL